MMHSRVYVESIDTKGTKDNKFIYIHIDKSEGEWEGGGVGTNINGCKRWNKIIFLFLFFFQPQFLGFYH